MSIPIKLEAFEGPLDLLLHLIEKNKLNIYDIPIVEITDQYMEYIEQMEQENLDVMSEFLVMAATLLDIKSQMLLPPELTEDGEEIDPREELVQKLLEYKMYKYMSYELRDRQTAAAGHMYKLPTIPAEVKSFREPVDIDEFLGDLTLKKLCRVFTDIMRRRENRSDPIRSNFGTMTKETIDMAVTMHYVEDYIVQHRVCSFQQLISLKKGKMYKIVTFLTLLELMKVGKVEVSQQAIFSDFEVVFTGKEGETGNLDADYD